jgi:hypothetical protein
MENHVTDSIKAYAAPTASAPFESSSYEPSEIGPEEFDIKNINAAFAHLEAGKARYRVVLKL